MRHKNFTSVSSLLFLCYNYSTITFYFPCYIFQAVRSLQRALEIRESIDPDHPIMAQSFLLLGGLYAQWSKYGTAEAYYKQALEICEACKEEDKCTTARVLESLVVLYRKQNK